MRCLRSILGVTRRDRYRNDNIRRTLEMEDSITDVVRRRRLKWFGHTIRRPPENYVYQAYWGDYTARRPRGRPPKRWKDQIPEDVGMPLHRCERLALDRGDWWDVTPGLRHRARGRYDLRP